MARYSSEEALNNILNILDYMVIKDEQREMDNQGFDINQTDKSIISLLQGLVNTVSKKPEAGAGVQLQALAQGLNIIKDIDSDDILKVTSTIDTIGISLNKLAISDTSLNSLQTLIQFLTLSGLISKNNVDGIVYLSSILNKDIITSINDAINGLNISAKSIENVNRLNEIINTLSLIQPNIISKLNSIDKEI